MVRKTFTAELCLDGIEPARSTRPQRKEGEDYRLRIPIGGWMTWDDRLLEGRGVQPDVEVVPTPSEIGAGKDLALSESVGLIAN